jgi:hypothetical protein
MWRISRVAITACIGLLIFAVAAHDSRCAVGALIFAFVPILCGPRPYRFFGIVATGAALLLLVARSYS